MNVNDFLKKLYKRQAAKTGTELQNAPLLNLANSHFLANISHEIRTPMNAIIGFTEVLAEETLTDEQHHHVNIIRESAENLLKLINNMLDLFKIDTGRLDTNFVDYSLKQVFAVIDSLMRPQVMEKNLKFAILQCGQLPAQIHTDPARLRQCLVNLIDNAVKFTKEGHIYITVSLQDVNDEPYVCFDIEDTGIGIPPDRQELLFETLTQTTSGTTCKPGGLGLGLAVTKHLAHLLGGELSLTTSRVNKGSVFALTIPVGLDMRSQALFNKYDLVDNLDQYQDGDADNQERFSGRVLAAEDNPSNQALINLLLRKLDLDVTIVDDGEKAVNKALCETFDLIFMDIQMPNMDGYDATRLLRSKGVKTPIIALTAYAMKGDDKKCISAGCNDYLSKPISREKLLPSLRKYLPTKRKLATASGSGAYPPTT